MLIKWDRKDTSPIEFLLQQHTRGRAIFYPAIKLGNGSALVDSLEHPSLLLYCVALICFISGNTSHEKAVELVRNIPELRMIVVTDDDWVDLLRSEYGDKLKVQHRTRFIADASNREKLQKLMGKLPEDYVLNKATIEDMKSADKKMTRGLIPFWDSFENLIENGFAFCIKDDEKIVSMASTAFPFIDEFEIQVDTLNDEKYRRKGLATAVSAALIEYGLNNGMIAHWDAANEASVGLAKKLGFSGVDQWDAYYWHEPRE